MSFPNVSKKLAAASIAGLLAAGGLVACENSGKIDEQQVEAIVQKRLEDEANKKLAETNQTLAAENETLKARIAELEAKVGTLEGEKAARATVASAAKPAATPKRTAPSPAQAAQAEKQKAVQALRDQLRGGGAK